jgi:glycosyltransferase involved in cell wall biosynthesis
MTGPEIRMRELAGDSPVHRSRARILVSAYACEPAKGSEPGVGWNTARLLAMRHDVWVLTRANNQSSIDRALAESPQPGLHFLYCDLPARARWWKKGGRGVQLYYQLWQVVAYRVARRAHGEIGFHAVHHVTFGKYWGPTLMPRLGIPFVWGPLGGGESTPRRFWPGGGVGPVLSEGARVVARKAGESGPLVRRALRTASAILAPTPETRSRLQHLGAVNVRSYPGQTGLSEQEIRLLEELDEPDESVTRFLAISRLEHWKGIHLAIRALARCGVSDAKLVVVGDGPQRRTLERLVRTLGLQDRVRLLGALPRDQTFHELGRCHALVHASLHDFFPTACLEAMAAGKPVICLDTGGPAVQVGEGAGIRVAVEHPKQVVRDLAAAMERLAASRELRQGMGAAGRMRLRENFAWERQATALYRIYEEILGPLATRRSSTASA